MKKRVVKAMITAMGSMAVASALMIGGCAADVPALEEAMNPDEVIELDAWCIANESDAYHHSYETAIQELEEQYPNIKINMEYYENESYKTKLKSAMAADEVPDIVYSWAGGFSQGFAEAGKLLNLTPYYDKEYTELLPDSYTQMARYVDNSLYGVGYSINCSALMYNKEIFDEYGLEAPETWDQFMEICQTLVDNGVKPLCTSAKDTWCLAVIHDALALKSAGHDKVMSTLTRQGGSYDDEDFLYAAQQMQKLVEMGAFIDGAAGVNYNEQLEVFSNGEAAMMFQLANVCVDMYNGADDPDKFDVVPVPVVGDNAEITDMIGGTSDAFLVSAESEHPDQAAYVAFELARRIAAVADEDGITTSPWTDTEEHEAENAFVQKINDMKKSATSYVLWWDTTMISDDAAEYLSLLQQLFTGDITAEDFVSGMAYQLS